MYIHRIVHLVYEAVRVLSIYLSIVWQLYGVRGQGAVQMHTEGVRNCHLEWSGPHRAVNCHERHGIVHPLCNTLWGLIVCLHSMW